MFLQVPAPVLATGPGVTTRSGTGLCTLIFLPSPPSRVLLGGRQLTPLVEGLFTHIPVDQRCPLRDLWAQPALLRHQWWGHQR